MENEGKHTPFPWLIQDQGCYTLIYGPNGERVCKVLDNKKDAYLIVDIPDLLAENQRLKEENARLQSCHESELGVCEQHCDVVKKLREVVRVQIDCLKECKIDLSNNTENVLLPRKLNALNEWLAEISEVIKMGEEALR